MAKNKEKLVHCRYPKCMKLHETTELNANDAVKGGKSSYYHPDCYHTMQTVNQIRDLFIKEINPLLTGQQIGMLVSTIHNIVFSKHVDIDYLKFAVEYFIKNKPGALKYPAGLHYVVQDKNVEAAWGKEQQRKIKNELKQKQETIIINDEFRLDLPETAKTDNNKKSKFSSILGV